MSEQAIADAFRKMRQDVETAQQKLLFTPIHKPVEKKIPKGSIITGQTMGDRYLRVNGNSINDWLSTSSDEGGFIYGLAKTTLKRAPDYYPPPNKDVIAVMKPFMLKKKLDMDSKMEWGQVEYHVNWAQLQVLAKWLTTSTIYSSKGAFKLFLKPTFATMTLPQYRMGIQLFMQVYMQMEDFIGYNELHEKDKYHIYDSEWDINKDRLIVQSQLDSTEVLNLHSIDF